MGDEEHNTSAHVISQSSIVPVDTRENSIGLDCSITKLKHGLYMVQTTDFFYPIVDDPYVMGQIACSNVLSDIYTLGITEIDSLLMIWSVPTDMSPNERDVVFNLICDGFKERAKVANCNITGGDTKLNKWLIIGGVATAILPSTSMISCTDAEVGDGIVLTKPLGTNAATTIYRWLADPEKLKLLNDCISKSNIETAYHQAITSMVTLNRDAASLMNYFGAHAATDITGYGLMGHAENLLSHQKNSIDFIFDTLPLIKYMLEAELQLDHKFKLLQGRGIETSGGLLICLPIEKAQKFIEALFEKTQCESWLIGKVEKGTRKVRILESAKLNVITVTPPKIKVVKHD